RSLMCPLPWRSIRTVRSRLNRTRPRVAGISANRARPVTKRDIRILERRASWTVNAADRASAKPSLERGDRRLRGKALSGFFTKCRRRAELLGRADGGGRGACCEAVKRTERELTAIGIDSHQIVTQKGVAQDAVDA